jgi:hypothetical protein
MILSENRQPLFGITRADVPPAAPALRPSFAAQFCGLWITLSLLRGYLRRAPRQILRWSKIGCDVSAAPWPLALLARLLAANDLNTGP